MELTSKLKKKIVLKNTHELKGSKIAVVHDLTLKKSEDEKH